VTLSVPERVGLVGVDLTTELEQLAPLERKLLHAIEEVGGEVETEELLDFLVGS
jgi:hypothetical protein